MQLFLKFSLVIDFKNHFALENGYAPETLRANQILVNQVILRIRAVCNLNDG